MSLNLWPLNALGAACDILAITACNTFPLMPFPIMTPSSMSDTHPRRRRVGSMHCRRMASARVNMRPRFMIQRPPPRIRAAVRHGDALQRMLSCDESMSAMYNALASVLMRMALRTFLRAWRCDSFGSLLGLSSIVSGSRNALMLHAGLLDGTGHTKSPVVMSFLSPTTNKRGRCCGILKLIVFSTRTKMLYL